MRYLFVIIAVGGAVACDPIEPDPGPTECRNAGTQSTRYVVNTMTMPTQRTDFAIDLNGDGRVDNQLGNLLAAGISADVQTRVDAAIATDGSILLLLDVKTYTPEEIAAGATDGCGGVEVSHATVTPSPDLSGGGSFTVDASRPSSQFLGLTTNGFDGNPPPTTVRPSSLSLDLPLFYGGAIDTLLLQGAHLSFEIEDDGSLTGEIHGAARDSYVQSQLVYSFVASCNQQIQDEPASARSQELLAFDIGGCTNPDSSLAAADDDELGYCELASVLELVFVPDVDMEDMGGLYAPNPMNTDKDSLSVALGFTAVAATF